MTSTIIYDTDEITVEHITDKGVIFHQIHTPIQGDIFRKALDTGTEVLRQNGLCKWLSDDRKNGPLSDADGAWGIVDWGPRTVEAGWKYWANVVPEEVAAAETLQGVINAFFEIGVRMMVFTTLEDALDWLDRLEC